MTEDEEHEHAHVVYVQQETPSAQFTPAGIVGIVFYGIGGVLSALSQAFSLVGREFERAGNFGRERRAYKRHRRLAESEAREEVSHLREMYELGEKIPEAES